MRHSRSPSILIKRTRKGLRPFRTLSFLIPPTSSTGGVRTAGHGRPAGRFIGRATSIQDEYTERHDCRGRKNRVSLRFCSASHARSAAQQHYGGQTRDYFGSTKHCDRCTLQKRVCFLETSLWKLSAGFEPSFLVDIGNWLAGQGPSVSNTARRRRSKFSQNRAPARASLTCLLYTSPSPRDRTRSRMPSSA